MKTSPNKDKITHPNIKNYTIENVLGVGSYGKVKLASHKLTLEKVAIKFVDKCKLIKPSDIKRMKREMKIINEMNHPNILKSIEIFEDEVFYYIVMEQPTKGDLFNHICERKRLSLTEATFMFYQMVNAMDYIHKKGIVHRDMKPENFMLSEDMIVKFGDFGLSNYYTDNNKLKTICGSPAYSAPEMLKGRPYDPIPIDIWGLGVMLYIMLCGKLPFEDESPSELYNKIVHCNIQYPYYCNANCKALIKRILVPNPQDRMTLEDIKNSNVYMTGKANFLRKFKIYDYDGTILPQVQSYIKEKTICGLAECASVYNEDPEKTSGYQVIFYKILHKTEWEKYHIPINSLEDRAIPLPIATEKNDNGMSRANTKDIDKLKGIVSGNKLTRNKKQMNGLLMIRSHSTLTQSLSQKYPTRREDPPFEAQTYKAKSPTKPINLSSRNNDNSNAILAHSETNLKIKPINLSNINQQGNTPHKNGKMHKSSSGKSSMKIKQKNNQQYTEKDYEKDIEYLSKKGYKNRHGSLPKTKTQNHHY